MGGGGYNKCRGLEVEAVGEQAALARWSLRGVPSKEKKMGEIQGQIWRTQKKEREQAGL